MSDVISKPRSVDATVRACFEAFRDRRRADAEAVIADDFTFTSPYDDGIDRAAYFERCWPNGDRFAGFDIERVVVDGDAAFVTYLATLVGGMSFRNTEYLTVRDGQVTSVNVYFGPSYRGGQFVAQKPGS